MTLLGIAWRNIRQRFLTSGLTALALALGVTLVVATLVIGNAVTQAFNSGSGLGYNMIVGAKGSPLQLVLNSVYLISRPIENVPWSFYEDFLPGSARADGADGQFAGSVATVLIEAVLLAVAGGLAGWLLGHLLVAAIGPLVATDAGVSLGVFSAAPVAEVLLVPFLIGLAILAGLMPALAAYRTDVARWLS